MIRRGNNWVLGAACAALTLSIGQSSAQDTQWWNVAGPATWNDDDNWVNRDFVVNSGIPEVDFGDSAGFDNNGTAFVDREVPSVAGLILTTGTLDIQQGGSLTVKKDDEGNGGDSTLGDRGVLQLSGNAALETGNLTSTGSISLRGAAAGLKTREDFTTTGVLALDISEDGNAQIDVGGAAAIGGRIEPTFSGISPDFGDSFEFVTGASSVTNIGAELVLPDSVQLARGLGAVVSTTNSAAAITISNFPILTLNRVTGEASMSNIVGGPLDVIGYSILSDNGLLKTDGFGLGGDWQIAATNGPTALSDLNLSSQITLEVGADGVSVGTPYNGGAAHPDDEDVRFQVALADGQVVNGLVEYEGPANNLTLRIDPDTGEAEISNQSSFVDPFDVTGYSIRSSGGALNVANWTGLGGDWTIANPTANAIAEFNVFNSQVFGTNVEHALGAIFDTTKARDVTFQFSTVDSVLTGTVEYGPLDEGGIEGDVDGDGVVGFADFLILSANFGQAAEPAGCCGDIDGDGAVAFADFLILSANFGQSAAAAASVPEPSNLVLVCFASLLSLARRDRSGTRWSFTNIAKA